MTLSCNGMTFICKVFYTLRFSTFIVWYSIACLEASKRELLSDCEY
jgi:hypothetical protein